MFQIRGFSGFFFKYLYRIYWLNIPNPQEQTPTSYINQEVDAFNLDNEELIPWFVFGLGNIYQAPGTPNFIHYLSPRGE